MSDNCNVNISYCSYNIKTCLFLGICGVIAVIVFASLGNTDGWMPDHPNNYLGKQPYNIHSL